MLLSFLVSHQQRGFKLKNILDGHCMKRYIVVDSRDRNYDIFPDPGEYVVTLPETFFNVSSARLMTAELPTSFFVFSQDQNNTSITVRVNASTTTLTIPDGNYGFTSMATALAAGLNAAFAGRTFTVVVSKVTLKATITSSVPTDVITIDTTTLDNDARTQYSLAYYLGFPRDALVSGTGSVVSTRVCSLNPELNILLDIEELGTMREAGLEGRGGTMARGTFAKIPINVDSYEICFFDKHAATCNDLIPPLAKLTKLHIRYRFHDGTLVNFNGVEHSLLLELECTATRN